MSLESAQGCFLQNIGGSPELLESISELAKQIRVEFGMKSSGW
jgi:hypothetical protein